MKQKFVRLFYTSAVFMSLIMPSFAEEMTTFYFEDGNLVEENSKDETIYYNIEQNNQINKYANIKNNFTVTIPKITILNGVKGDFSTISHEISVEGNIDENAAILIQPQEDAFLLQPGKENIKMQINQSANEYKSGSTGKVDISAVLSSGTWTGAFDFDIKLLKK